MDILCVGEMLIDFTPGKEPGSYIKNPGGAPANVAIAAGRLGLKAGFCGMLGDDDFGRFLLDTIIENGVESLCPPLNKSAVTTMAFVTLQPGGERSFTFARKPGADMLLAPEDIKQEYIERAKIVHAGSVSLSAGSAREATRYALKKAHEAGKKVSFDVNYRNLLWDNDEREAAEQVKSILPFVDFLKVSVEEIGIIGSSGSIEDVMKENGIKVVALTGGEGMTKVYCDDFMIEQGAYRVNAIDATGAGDAFWGAFLAKLLSYGVDAGTEISEEIATAALEQGMLAGSLAVQKHGAIPSLPTMAQINEAAAAK